MMKKIAIICFTFAGAGTAKRCARSLVRLGYPAEVWIRKADLSRVPAAAEDGMTGGGDLIKQVKSSVREWTARRFSDSDAVVFIGAAGIAVRSVAPFIVSKDVDPAVLVVDEKAVWVISLLSGHLGGANELAWILAEELGAVPVVTTATDLNRRFSPDTFARQNRLILTDLMKAKKIAAAILDGRKIGFYADPEIMCTGLLPPELKSSDAGQYASRPPETDHPAAFRPSLGHPDSEKLWQEENTIMVTFRRRPWPLNALVMIPKMLVIGAGCRKGTDPAGFDLFVQEFLEENRVCPEAVAKICSIDVKAEESALTLFSQNNRIPYTTFSAEELNRAEGTFSCSDFVRRTVGVDCVCERAAVLGAGNGKLLAGKTVRDGMTLALAAAAFEIRFSKPHGCEQDV